MNFLNKMLKLRSNRVDTANPCGRAKSQNGAHMKAAADFKWDRAATSDVAYSYDDGSMSAFAVGKDDWMNVMTAMCAIYEQHSHRGFRILQNAIGDSAWVKTVDERILSWLSANEKIFQNLPKLIHDSKILPMEERVVRCAHPKAVEYSPYRIANIYLGAWQRRFPPVMNELLIICDGIGGDYWEHPDIEGAQQAAKVAFETTRNLVLEWFEVRGLETDRKDHLVRVDGYRPLYMIHTIEI